MIRNIQLCIFLGCLFVILDCVWAIGAIQNNDLVLAAWYIVLETVVAIVWMLSVYFHFKEKEELEYSKSEEEEE